MTFSGRYTPESDPEAILQRMAQFQAGTYQRCPICEREIDGATAYFKKFMPDMCTIYLRPCDCRLGLYVGIPEWLQPMTEAHFPHDDYANEPTVQELRDAGEDVELTPEYWRQYNERQEAAGQLRLPFCNSNSNESDSE